jgi:DNA-binding transcriptional MerR regulator
MERNFSIKDLETLSGVKAHTIRIWEKRYNLLNPTRTETNIRMYDNDQLRKLIVITNLIENGFKISNLAKKPDEELHKLLDEIAAQEKNVRKSSDYYFEGLIDSMLQINEEKFEKIFSTCVLRYGLIDTFSEILYPFLERVGLMWCTDKILPAQEHFITQLIKRKLHVAIDGFSSASQADQQWLLYLPQGEYHNIGLLVAHFLLRSRGHNCVYLGSSVPYENIKPTKDLTSSNNILTFIVKYWNSGQVAEYLDNLENDFEDCNIYVALGEGMINEEDYPNIHFMHNIPEFKEYLDKEN